MITHKLLFICPFLSSSFALEMWTTWKHLSVPLAANFKHSLLCMTQTSQTFDSSETNQKILQNRCCDKRCLYLHYFILQQSLLTMENNCFLQAETKTVQDYICHFQHMVLVFHYPEMLIEMLPLS